MCTGAEIAAAAQAAGPYIAAASAGSQLAGSYAQSRSARAQNDAQQQAMQAHSERQSKLQEEANRAIGGASETFDPAKQNPQLEAAQAARTAAAAPAPVPTQGYQTTTASAPKVVETDMERKLTEALSGGREAANRAGALQGYGDSAQTNQINLGRAGQRVGQLGNFSQGTSNALPLQLRSAYNRGGNWGESGDALDSLGRLGTLYSLTRKPRGGMGYGTADPAGSSAYDSFGNLVPAI